MKKIIVLTVLIISSFNINAQNKEVKLTSQEMREVVDSVSFLLERNYIFPEVAEEMEQVIRKKLKKGEYDKINDPKEFAQQLSKDLLSVSNDKHIKVFFNPEGIAEQRKVISPKDSIQYAHKKQEKMRINNYGFKEVKILDGNVGFIDFRIFLDPAYGGETAVAAMNFVSNADALIFDLRNNGGGSSQMIQLLISYLYTAEPVHLNNFYWRPTNSNYQTWTLPHVPGKRRPDIDVYVLTSDRTFSAAEEFTYDLKNLKRATIIGETTGGGAHPGGPQIATDRFVVWIPSGRAINPITQTNWEGVGVKPDIEIDEELALVTAQIEALQKLKEKTEDLQQKAFYQKLIDKTKTEKSKSVE